MRLQPNLILYIAETVIGDLLRAGLLVCNDRERLAGMVQNIIVEDLEREDRLDEEARELLSRHYELVRSSGAEYEALFRKVKARLADEKGIIL